MEMCTSHQFTFHSHLALGSGFEVCSMLWDPDIRAGISSHLEAKLHDWANWQIRGWLLLLGSVVFASL